LKTCPTCEESKPDTEFYARVRHCKTCWKARVLARKQAEGYAGEKAHRERYADHYRAYEKARAMNPDRVAARAAYEKTPAGTAARNKATRMWKQKNPDKRNAETALGNAIRDGRIVKPSTCERCGNGGRLDGHHADYTKPLDVEWLCRLCHKAEHR